MAELTVVMPVYNEEGAIAAVLGQWTATLQALGADYRIVVYNDGSKDGTAAALEAVAQGNPRIKVIDKANSGHGPTILQGYLDYCDSPWIFQVDSDGELGQEEFASLWERRENYDFLIGKRVNRKSPLIRRLMTWVSRRVVWLFFGRAVVDVNCPYRLFRPGRMQGYLRRIPPRTFAPNLIVAGLAGYLRLRVYQTEVVHTVRQTGEVSIKRWKLLRAALLSCMQTVTFRLRCCP